MVSKLELLEKPLIARQRFENGCRFVTGWFIRSVVVTCVRWNVITDPALSYLAAVVSPTRFSVKIEHSLLLMIRPLKVLPPSSERPVSPSQA